MPRFRFALLPLAAAVGLCSPSIVRAERVEAPLELLNSPGNTLVAGTLIVINPAGRLVFGRKDVLGDKGRPPEQIDVRVPLAALKDAKIGERYIVGYMDMRADPRHPSRVMRSPDGAVALTSIGLEPALFHEDEATRAILKTGRSEHGRESRRLFERLLKALAGTDPALRLLAVGEFTQEPELGEYLREDAARAAIEKAVRNPAMPPGVRERLLAAAATRSGGFGTRWPQAALDIVTNTPLD